MAKAIKPKKKVNPPTVTEPIVEETKIETIPEPIIEEPEIGETPPSVTFDEVKEVEEKEIPVEFKEIVEQMEKTTPTEKVFHTAPTQELSIEEKILNFIESKSGEIKMNDFLKSLFGVSIGNEPPKWANQGASKLMKATLDKLVKEKVIKINNDNHLRLGQFYYPDSTTGKTEYHNLNTVPIIFVM